MCRLPPQSHGPSLVLVSAAQSTAFKDGTHLMVMRRLLPFGTSNFFGCVRKWLMMLDTSSPPLVARRGCLPCCAIERVTRMADAAACRRTCTTGAGRFIDLATTSPGRRLLITACRLLDATAECTRARYEFASSTVSCRPTEAYHTHRQRARTAALEMGTTTVFFTLCCLSLPPAGTLPRFAGLPAPPLVFFCACWIIASGAGEARASAAVRKREEEGREREGLHTEGHRELLLGRDAEREAACGRRHASCALGAAVLPDLFFSWIAAGIAANKVVIFR